MIRAIKATVTRTAVAFVCLTGSAVLGQPSDGETDADLASPTPVDEEIVVQGRTRAALRLQIRLAEEAIFERFNAINSDDEFDVHCRQEMLTGSRISRRNCQAVFWRNAQADAGTETTRALQGAFAFGPQPFLGETLRKRQQMSDEMRRLSTEDEELRRALANFANLTQAMNAGRLSEPPARTASNTQTAVDEPLPYDASVVADVRIGSKPWRHRLSGRTFTIALAQGEIRSVQVECRGQTEELPYDAGVEWTLPKDWRACAVRIDALPATTFSLYEFD